MNIRWNPNTIRMVPFPNMALWIQLEDRNKQNCSRCDPLNQPIPAGPLQHVCTVPCGTEPNSQNMHPTHVQDVGWVLVKVMDLAKDLVHHKNTAMLDSLEECNCNWNYTRNQLPVG
jgi:hypothetical protein